MADAAGPLDRAEDEALTGRDDDAVGVASAAVPGREAVAPVVAEPRQAREAAAAEVERPLPLRCAHASTARRKAQALASAVSWLEESRRVWSERMDRLEAHLARLQESAGHEDPEQP